MSEAFSAAEHAWMARALQLAERGLLNTTPNPRVGCVIVRDDKLLGEGWTQAAGHNHAEVEALEDAAARAHDVRGATAYVSLEPCAHFGRTPPCALALRAAGIASVVAAMQDPNPLVAGRGFALLQEAGITCRSGLLASAAAELNRGFISRMTRQRPWVQLKIASSLDGRTALANGHSQWITGKAARADVQRARARACAVLTGIGTVLADDPQLNVRSFASPRQPLRVVLDSALRTPPAARILHGGNTLLVHASGANEARQHALRQAGAELLECGVTRIDLSSLLNKLAARGINELMVEAGATLAGAFASAGVVDEYLLYLAPALLGSDARGMLDLPMLQAMSEVRRLRWVELRQLDEDLRAVLRPL